MEHQGNEVGSVGIYKLLLIRAHRNFNSIISLANVCMRRCKWNELWNYYLALIAGQQHSCWNFLSYVRGTRTICAMMMFSPCLNIKSKYWTIDRYDREQSTSPLASFEAAQQASQTPNASRPSFKNASLWPPLFVHTALQFWPILSLVNLQKSASFFALQARTQTIFIPRACARGKVISLSVCCRHWHENRQI